MSKADFTIRHENIISLLQFEKECNSVLNFFLFYIALATICPFVMRKIGVQNFRNFVKKSQRKRNPYAFLLNKSCLWPEHC